MQMYNSSRVVPIFVGSSPHPKIEGKKNGRFTGCLKLCARALPYKAFNPFIYILWPTLRSFPSMFLQIDCSQSIRMVFPTLITHVILLTTVYLFSFTRVVVPSITYLWLILFIIYSYYSSLSPSALAHFPHLFWICSFKECIF